MQRQQHQQGRPEEGCLSTPLFIQKKRNRVPLTSAPSENEFLFHPKYTANILSDTSNCMPGTYSCYQASSSSSSASQVHHWNIQGKLPPTHSLQYGSNRPAPGPTSASRTYTPAPHPYKVKSMCSKMEQPTDTVRQQDSCSSGKTMQSKYQALGSSQDVQRKLNPRLPQMGQQSSYKPPNPAHHYSQQSRPLPPPVPHPIRPSAHGLQPQRNSWNFTNSFESQTPTFRGKRSSIQTETAKPTTTKETVPKKPGIENSLRILTVFINGMRHWNQFKNKVPFLFEIFATLDSAVTLGHHGAKNFLLRDGKEVVQCIFYENEQVLPRLIRGQVQRCVGNYDRSKDVLVCVSVRPGLPSELRNAKEAVKVCDAEMRDLVKLFREV